MGGLVGVSSGRMADTVPWARLNPMKTMNVRLWVWGWGLVLSVGVACGGQVTGGSGSGGSTGSSGSTGNKGSSGGNGSGGNKGSSGGNGSGSAGVNGSAGSPNDAGFPDVDSGACVRADSICVFCADHLWHCGAELAEQCHSNSSATGDASFPPCSAGGIDACVVCQLDSNPEMPPTPLSKTALFYTCMDPGPQGWTQTKVLWCLPPD
jgi:hypothetical protein